MYKKIIFVSKFFKCNTKLIVGLSTLIIETNVLTKFKLKFYER